MHIRTHGRTNVQAVAFLVGDPIRVEPDELLDEVDDGFSIECLNEKDAREVKSRQYTRPVRIRTGNAIRAALLFIRRMFISGRKRVILPLASL